MSTSSNLQEFRQMSLLASELNADSLDIQAILGFLAGAYFALSKAFILGYIDRSGDKVPPNYPEELRDLFKSIGKAELPTGGQWLAGFYFNSALQRLAALYHRTLKIILNTPPRDRTPAPKLAQKAIKKGLISVNDLSALATVHRDVNKLKHDTFGVLEDGRSTDPALAVMAGTQALSMIRLVVGSQE